MNTLIRNEQNWARYSVLLNCNESQSFGVFQLLVTDAAKTWCPKLGTANSILREWPGNIRELYESCGSPPCTNLFHNSFDEISHEGVKMIYGHFLTVSILNSSGQNDESEEFSETNFLRLFLKSNTWLFHFNRNRKRL